MVARTKHAELATRHDLLVKVDNRLDVADPTILAIASRPRVTRDFKAWDIYVPSSPACELRFAAGEMSPAGTPQDFESVKLSPGRHQIILNEQDSNGRDSYFQCYVDGQLKLDKRMDAEWLPNGWRQASSWNLPNRGGLRRQLSGRRYMSKIDFGPGKYFNGNLDDWSTVPSYALWIDRADQAPEPISPFLEFKKYSYWHSGIGFRDGPRFQRGNRAVGLDLNFNHPATRLRDAALRIKPEFLAGGKDVLSGPSLGTTIWNISNAADSIKPFKSNRPPTIKSQTAFLHATGVPTGAPAPVIELRWDLDRPNEIGLRLAETAANASLTRWRLNCPDGLSHLWRLIDTGDASLDSRKIAAAKPNDLKATVTLTKPNQGMHTVRWKTDVLDPLQVYQRDKAFKKQLAGISLYQGLPVEFSLKLPETAKPKVWAQRLDQIPETDNSPIPGGSIFSDVTIEIDAKTSAWIWLSID
jgi:hypothetical protein